MQKKILMGFVTIEINLVWYKGNSKAKEWTYTPYSPPNHQTYATQQKTLFKIKSFQAEHFDFNLNFFPMKVQLFLS